MPRWYDALRQIVGGGTKMSTDEKAALLGVPAPGRRSFFKVGGATIMGAAVLAACGDTDDDIRQRHQHARRRRWATARTSMDLALARTAASLEKLAVDTYQTGIDSGLVTTMAIADAATLFQSHHQEHLDALNGAITDAGGEEVTEPNEAVFKALDRAGRRPRPRRRRTSCRSPSTSRAPPPRPTCSPAAPSRVPDPAVHDHDDRRHRGPARGDPPGRRPGRSRRPTCSPAGAASTPATTPWPTSTARCSRPDRTPTQASPWAERSVPAEPTSLAWKPALTCG